LARSAWFVEDPMFRPLLTVPGHVLDTELCSHGLLVVPLPESTDVERSPVMREASLFGKHVGSCLAER